MMANAAKATRTLKLKRESHKHAEQARRDQLRGSMDRLATLVSKKCCQPSCIIDTPEAPDGGGAAEGHS
jgi:hypothetical protein